MLKQVKEQILQEIMKVTGESNERGKPKCKGKKSKGRDCKSESWREVDMRGAVGRGKSCRTQGMKSAGRGAE